MRMKRRSKSSMSLEKRLKATAICGSTAPAGIRKSPLCCTNTSRGGKHPKAFLNGFHGYLHTDGYAGYHNLPGEITVVGCWAHARRKFDEAVKSLPKGKAKGSSASQGLAYCNLLFEIEQSLEGTAPEERYKQRLKQAKPV